MDFYSYHSSSDDDDSSSDDSSSSSSSYSSDKSNNSETTKGLIQQKQKLEDLLSVVAAIYRAKQSAADDDDQSEEALQGDDINGDFLVVPTTSATERSSSSSSSNQDHGLELNQLPPGWKFIPRDAELILHYLINKIFGLPLPSQVIKDVDFYQYDPSQLPINEFKFLEKNEAYFFTNTVLRYSKGIQPRKSTPNGFWKAWEPDLNIYHENVVIGYKKIVAFYWGTPCCKIASPWIMYEYRVNPKIFQADTLDETIRRKMESCVICKITS